MKNLKKEIKDNKKIIKIIDNEINKSKLNYFIFSCINKTTDCELCEKRDKVINKIKYNNYTKMKLNNELRKYKVCNEHEDIIKKYIDDIEYENICSKEILKLLNLKIERKKYVEIIKNLKNKKVNLLTVGD